MDGYEQGLSAGAGREQEVSCGFINPPTLFLLLGYTTAFGLQPWFLLKKQKTLRAQLPPPPTGAPLCAKQILQGTAWQPRALLSGGGLLRSANTSPQQPAGPCMQRHQGKGLAGERGHLSGIPRQRAGGNRPCTSLTAFFFLSDKDQGEPCPGWGCC